MTNSLDKTMDIQPTSVHAKAENGHANGMVVSTIHPTKINMTDEDKLAKEADEHEDPWKLVDWKDEGKKWSEMSMEEKAKRTVINICKIIMVICLLYLFICSLDLLSSAFQLIGGRMAGEAFKSDSLLSNPVAGMMMGVIVTAILQSSSTSTSIVVTMVSANIVPVKMAIPIVMGANVGTTVTNTFVSLTMSGDKNTFRRAFGAATVHDMFNWLSILTLLPIEVATGYLYLLTSKITETMKHGDGKEPPKFLKVITEPFTHLIVEIDDKVIGDIARKNAGAKRPLPRYWCNEKTIHYAKTFDGEKSNINKTFHTIVENQIWTRDFVYNWDNITNRTSFEWETINETASKKCVHLFQGQGMPGAPLSEGAVGAILLVIALVTLVTCLVFMVKILQSLMKGSLAKVIRKMINADFPGKFACLTGYVALFVGAGMTLLVQSSSVFTATMTPLVGMGMVEIERLFPLVLGSNIGTTGTGILAALTADLHFQQSMQVALCHLFFNLTGILIYYPIPFMRKIPITIARTLGNTTAEYRWFAVFYLILMFIIIPSSILGLSIAGWPVLLGVGLPALLLLITVIIIKVSQKKCPGCLPQVLKDDTFLPKPLRSLEPFDKILRFLGRKISGCCSCCPCKNKIADNPIQVHVNGTKDSKM